MNLLLYNPSHIDPQELSASFVDREHEQQQLFGLLQNAEGPRQHAIIVGPRGMGKTALGLHFCQQVSLDPILANLWTPVIFFEESYGIADPADFWLAALRHLSDSTHDDRWSAIATSLAGSEKSEEKLAIKALSSLLRYCSESGKGLILFVDNLHQVFEQFRDKRRALHALRETLIKRNEILVVGTANAVFDEISNRHEAFYNFFKLIILRPFGSDETLEFLKRRALLTNDQALRAVIATDRGRLEVIRRLTGGAPRWLNLACRLLAETPTGKIQNDIERLVDEQTPYFKAQIDSLSPQLRRTFHIVAAHWSPMLAREVAGELRTTSSHASASLAQLREAGLIEELTIGNEKRSRYQVRERLYNIYYISRFTRSQKQRLEALVLFIQELFGPPAIEHIFRTALDKLRLHKAFDEHERDAFPIYARYFVHDEQIHNREVLWKQALTLCSDARIVLPELIRLSPVILKTGGSELRIAIEKLIEDGSPSVEQLVGLADEIGRYGHYREARALLAKAVDRAPDDMIAWHRLGIASEFAGDLPAAIEAFRELAAIAPNDAHPFVHLAMLYLQAGDKQLALGAATEAERHKPMLTGDSAKVGAVFASVGEIDRAIPLADEAVKHDFSDTITADAVAYVYLRADRPEDAINALQRGIKSRPDTPPLWDRLSAILTSQKQPGRLRTLAQQYLKRDDQNVAAWFALVTSLEPEQAESVLKQATKAVPRSDRLWTQLGDFYYYRKDAMLAAEAYGEAARLNGSNADALHQLGVTLQMLGDLEGAEHAFEGYGAIAGREGDALIHLSGIRSSQGRHDEAVQLARRAVEAEPSTSFSWRALARVEFDCGHRAQSLDATNRALQLDPTDFDVLRLRAQLLVSEKDFDGARLALDEAIKHGARDADNLAVCAARLRELDVEPSHYLDVARDAYRLDSGSIVAASLLVQLLIGNSLWDEAFDVLYTWAKRSPQLWSKSGVRYFLDSFVDAIARGKGHRVLELLDRVPNPQFEPLALAAKVDSGSSIPVQPAEIRDAVSELCVRIATRRTDSTRAPPIPDLPFTPH